MMELLLPVGRMIGGSVYKGQPVQDKPSQPAGANEHQQLRFHVGYAIPKAGESHWKQTEWGLKIWTEGSTAFPREHLYPSFAWKITDGDSTVPNQRGNIPCQQEGYAGHWVIWGNQGWAPLLCNERGQILTDNDVIYPGCYIQMVINVTGNKSTQSPGIYINPAIVAFLYHGKRIVTQSADPSGFKFGGGPLPPGASQTPVSAFNPATAGGMPVNPATASDMGSNPAAVFPPVPNMAFLQPPPAQPQVIKTANWPVGVTYEQMLNAGWTDSLLRQHGFME